MSKIKVNSGYKELVNMFYELTGAKSMWEVLNDCIECFAISFRNIMNAGSNYEKLENRYKEIMNRYTSEQRKYIVKIFAKIIEMANENPFRDLLGELYMQLDMGSNALGQFFTPYHVSYLMSEISFDKKLAEEMIDEKGYITVNEPAVGGGANIIAFCEVLYNNDINYQSQCVIQCQDLNRLTALMCYVMLSLLGCSAVVKIGDTLSDPYTNYYNEVKKGSEIWTTPMFHVNNCYGKI